ncbi:MAG: polysaccharide biosynthesis protein [Clostridia bacterium]|nr:polysaccharide biosynthesis protein [Clostridia bacterium]
MSRKKQGFVGGALILMLSNVVVKIVGALFKIPLKNVIGTTAMGYFGTAYSVYSMFFLISTAGLPVAISRMIAAAKAREKAREVERIYRVSLLIFMTIGAIGTAILFFGANGIAALPKEPELAICLRTISPIMFFICVASCVRGYFQGLQNMTPTAVSQVVEVMGNLCIGLTLGVWAKGRGYDAAQVASFVLAGVTIGVVLSAVYLFFAKSIAKQDKESGLLEQEKVRSGSSLAKELIRIAIPITVASSVLSLTSVIDSMVAVGRMKEVGVGLGYISAIVKEEKVAISVYGAYTGQAVTLFNMPPTITYPFAISIIPAISSALSTGNREGLKKTMDFTFRIVSVICLPLAVGMGVMSRPIMDLLFSNEDLFRTANGITTSNGISAAMLTILSVAILFSGLVSVSGAMLQAYGYERKSIISTSLGVLSKFISVYLFVGFHAIGAYGIPLSTLTCYLIMFIFNMFFLVKYVGYRFSIRKVLLRPFIAAALCGGAAMGGYLLLKLFISAKIATVAGILLGALVYVAALFLFRGFEKDDVLQMPKGDKILKILVKLHLVRG